MKVANVAPSYVIDEDMEIIDESSWDFYCAPAEAGEADFEFFEEVADLKLTVARSRSVGFGVIIGIGLCVICVVVAIGFAVYRVRRGEPLATEKAGLVYVEGDELTSAELLEAGNLLNGYFKVLKSGKGYDRLTGYVIDGDSEVAARSEKYRSMIRGNYDLSDCYYRAMTYLGSKLGYDGVTKAVWKDDLCYCYVKLTMITDANIEEFAYMVKFNASKHFTSSKVTQEEVLKYALTLMSDNDIPVTNGEWCFVLRRDADGSLKMVSDGLIADACEGGYGKIVDNICDFIYGTLK